MKNPLFSIIVVALNPGEKLLHTIESVREQKCQDLEIIVKDGGSKDGSVTALKQRKEEALQSADDRFWEKVKIIERPDKSIYEGMNQGIEYASGHYLYFLNCGDYFYDENVLQHVKNASRQEAHTIVYGDIYDALQHTRVASNPKMDGFACYRNVPCHQACFYSRDLFAERGYNPAYKVRADYEHFLWCFYKKKAVLEYVPEMFASYEGGGYSETKANLKRSADEHKEITATYMSKGELFRYRAILFLTLAPLRTRMAHSPALSGCYNACKKLIYGIRK